MDRMKGLVRGGVVALVCAVVVSGCAAGGGGGVVADGDVDVSGAIVSIDTSPWMYDGNAVVVVDSEARGRLAVQLPARWNLCAAGPVDVEALRVGMRVRVVGNEGADGEVVVCQGAGHRLVGWE